MSVRDQDPAITDPGLYHVIFENEQVRVLEYRDKPGDQTHPHDHPNSIMVTLSAFRRRVSAGDRHVDVDLAPGQVRWLDAQRHSGANTGDTATHAIFVELKEPHPVPDPGNGTLGPR